MSESNKINEMFEGSQGGAGSDFQLLEKLKEESEGESGWDSASASMATSLDSVMHKSQENAREKIGRMDKSSIDKISMEAAKRPTQNGHHGMSEEEVKTALDNIDQIFPQNLHLNETKGSAGSQRTSEKLDSLDFSSRLLKDRRGRVDSTARPQEFFRGKDAARRNGVADGQGGVQSKTVSVNFEKFKKHHINSLALRERLDSGAIDVSTVDRVQREFARHDKLSQAELSSLHELVDRAQDFHRNNDLKEAQKLYMKVLLTDPLDWDSLCNLAKISFGLGEYDKAKELFERALVIRPERDKTMYYLGQVLVRIHSKGGDKNQLQRAMVLFEQVVNGYKGVINCDTCDQSTYHNAMAMLGLVHQESGELDKAEELYQLVLKEVPNHVLTLDHRCALKSLQGLKDEAAKDHLHVIELDPGHTKRVCPYLDSLFPKDSEILHPMNDIKDRFDKFDHSFGEGKKKRSWIKSAIHGFKKKMKRMIHQKKA
mmetsp:Transcript_13360/g.30759  ORF Transcript_13360/g.30759 Transcript_13360/m.30759 type:complete len:485 (-) Transcript_13360:114-1568(-)